MTQFPDSDIDPTLNHSKLESDIFRKYLPTLQVLFFSVFAKEYAGHLLDFILDFSEDAIKWRKNITEDIRFFRDQLYEYYNNQYLNYLYSPVLHSFLSNDHRTVPSHNTVEFTNFLDEYWEYDSYEDSAKEMEIRTFWLELWVSDYYKNHENTQLELESAIQSIIDSPSTAKASFFDDYYYLSNENILIRANAFTLTIIISNLDDPWGVLVQMFREDSFSKIEVLIRESKKFQNTHHPSTQQQMNNKFVRDLSEKASACYKRNLKLTKTGLAKEMGLARTTLTDRLERRGIIFDSKSQRLFFRSNDETIVKF